MRSAVESSRPKLHFHTLVLKRPSNGQNLYSPQNKRRKSETFNEQVRQLNKPKKTNVEKLSELKLNQRAQNGLLTEAHKTGNLANHQSEVQNTKARIPTDLFNYLI